MKIFITIVVAIVAYILIRRSIEKKKVIENELIDAQDAANAKERMEAFMSVTEGQGIEFLTVAGYNGKMSNEKEFCGSLKEQADACISFIEHDLIKEGAAIGGGKYVNYNIDLLKDIVASALCTKEGDAVYIRASETEITVAIPCVKPDIRQEAAAQLTEAGYSVHPVADITQMADYVTAEYDEKEKIEYVMVPIHPYFKVSDTTRGHLNYASRGGHHHAYS